jgi:hypothetical protein
MTYLVDRYMAAETVITAAKTGLGFAGSLTANGNPVVGAQLSAYAVDDGTLNITTTPSLTGTVPAGAVSAVIALRINTECECNAPADILLGPTQYVDAITNASVTTIVVPPQQRIIVPAGQSFAINSSSFAVTSGDSYSFSAPMQLPYSSNNSGYVAVVFLNSAGTEIAQAELLLRAGQHLIGTNITDRTGRFAITAMSPSSITTFEFDGAPNLRISSLTLTQ